MIKQNEFFFLHYILHLTSKFFGVFVEFKIEDVLLLT